MPRVKLKLPIPMARFELEAPVRRELRIAKERSMVIDILRNGVNRR